MLYIAQSLDGYIADKEGSTQWLHDLPNPNQSDYGYQSFLESIETVIMGRKTYETILSFDVPWPYAAQKTYVLSRKEIPNLKEGVTQLTNLDSSSLQELKRESSKNLWLVGGGSLVKHCLENNLIDKIILFTMPINLGEGIPLFPESKHQQSWKLSHCEVYSSGVIQHEYIPQT